MLTTETRLLNRLHRFNRRLAALELQVAGLVALLVARAKQAKEKPPDAEASYEETFDWLRT